MMGLDIGLQTVLDTTTSFAQGTASPAFQHDHMTQFSVYLAVQDAAPASKTFVGATAMTTTTDQIVVTGHGFQNGLLVTLTTSSAIPTDLTTTGNYYVVVVDANTIQLALTRAAAVAGTPVVDITAKNGTGTQTIKPTALAGLGVHLEASMNGTNWFPIAATTLTSVGMTMMSFSGISYNYLRTNSTLTAGQIQETAIIRSLGFK